jgi:HEAT repeat protein
MSALRVEGATSGAPQDAAIAVPPQAERAAAILVSLGTAAIPGIGQDIVEKKWWVQRILAQVLGKIGTAAAVPPLQTLLKKADARVLPTVLTALTRIDDPAAARAIHTVLRAATGKVREVVVETLVGLRDPRVVPMIARIIDESEVLGRDFDLVLQAFDAIATFKDDRAVRPIATAAGKRRWLAPRRTGRMRERAVLVLNAIDSRAARHALESMRVTGDWHLRRVVRRAPRAVTVEA